MSIVPLVKATLYGRALEKQSALTDLQQLGCLHLNKLGKDGSTATGAAAPGARRILEYLLDSPVRRPPLHSTSGFDAKGVIKEALEVWNRSKECQEERAQLKTWIAELEPWGSFDLPEWAQKGELTFWFYNLPHYQAPQLASLKVPYKITSRDHQFLHIVLISAKEPMGLPVAPVSLTSRSLLSLRHRLGQVELELEALESHRKGLTLYTELIKRALDEEDDRTAIQQAALDALERDQLFAIQGWVSADQKATIQHFAHDRHLGLTFEPPKTEEKPPTLLDNPSLLRGGEGLVTFYQTPGYRMWDPSQVIFLSFALFFAMILCDAGYGLLLGAALAILWKGMGKATQMRDLRWVMLTVIGATVIYGVMAGVYFGLEPRKGTFLSHLHLFNAKDHSFMMWLSIGVGAVHLVIANLISAWRRRKSLQTISSLGWASIILGGFGLGLAESYPRLHSLSKLGWFLLATGGVGVFLFSTEHPFSLKPSAVGERLVHGLKGVLELSKVFGDVLSYLRLFALGLAAVMLAEVFNDLGAKAWQSKGFGFVLGLFIVLVGHSINLVMGIMGGVVHGLRLNVIEFLNWSLPEDGVLFQAFACKKKG